MPQEGIIIYFSHNEVIGQVLNHLVCPDPNFSWIDPGDNLQVLSL